MEVQPRARVVGDVDRLAVAGTRGVTATAIPTRNRAGAVGPKGQIGSSVDTLHRPTTRAVADTVPIGVRRGTDDGHVAERQGVTVVLETVNHLRVVVQLHIAGVDRRACGRGERERVQE